MKTTRISSRDSALFAVLLRDECESRSCIDPFWAMDYLKFLRSQSKRGDRNDPYAMAVRIIEGRA